MSAAQESCADAATNAAWHGSGDCSGQQQQAAVHWACAASNAAQAITALVQQQHTSAQQALPAVAMQGLLSCFAALAPSVAAKAEPQQDADAVQLRMQRAAALQHVAHAAALLLAKEMQVMAEATKHHIGLVRMFQRRFSRHGGTVQDGGLPEAYTGTPSAACSAVTACAALLSRDSAACPASQGAACCLLAALLPCQEAADSHVQLPRCSLVLGVLTFCIVPS